MEITKKYHKIDTICNWKYKGVLYDDFDDLYETYIKTMNCGHCGKEFKNTLDRHLDHCHKTGQFRKIVCQRCNCYDNYINFPAGVPSIKEKYSVNKYKYNEKRRHKRFDNKEIINEKKREKYQLNKDEINAKAREKYTCECGSIIRISDKAQHKKTMKHARFMEQLD